jgi:hypothetical protein
MSNTEEERLLMPAVQDEEQPETLLDQLSAKRREIAETKETNILVPGYDREPPLLMIRYRLLDGTELDKIDNRVRRETKNRWQRTLLAAIDTFIDAVVGFYVDLGDGNPKPLTYHGNPLTNFGPDLAEAMQFADQVEDPNSHRQVVLGLFTNNDVMIAQHNYQLNRWFGDTSLDVNREMMEGNL